MISSYEYIESVLRGYCCFESRCASKPEKFTIYNLENHDLIEIIEVYSFLGQSAGLLGHNNVNFCSKRRKLPGLTRNLD